MAFEVLYLQTGETPARLDRWWIGRIFTEGVSDVQGGDLIVTERAAGPNLSVDVAAGEAIVDGDTIEDQGAYLARSTATVNVELAAPPAADSRIDLIVMRVYDSTATGGDPVDDGPWIDVVEGTAGAAPVVAVVPDTAIALAEVVVAAGAVSITDADIADLRTQLNSVTDVTSDEVWIPPSRLSAGISAPAESVLSTSGWTVFPTMLFDSTTAETVAFAVPEAEIAGWASFDVEVLWVNAGAGSGGVAWRFYSGIISVGSASSLVGPSPTIVSTLAGSQGVLMSTTVVSGMSPPAAGEIVGIQLNRQPGDAGDTLPNDAGLVGLKLRRAS